MANLDLLIDEMPLSTRARNVLKLNRVKTLGDLAAAISSDKPRRWKGCGPALAKEIREIAEPYLQGVPPPTPVKKDKRLSLNDQMARKSVLGRILSYDERVLAAAVPISELGLSPSCEETLRDRGLARLIDIAMAPVAQIHGIRELSRAHIEMIEAVVKVRLPAQAIRPDNTVLGRALSATEREAAQSMPIDTLMLSTRATNILKQLRWQTVFDVAAGNLRDLELSRNSGVASITEIKEALQGALASPHKTYALATFLGRALSDSERQYAEKTPIAAIGISGRAESIANVRGWTTLVDIADALVREVDGQAGVGTGTIEELQAVTRAAFAGTGSGPTSVVLGRHLTSAETASACKTMVDDLALSRPARAVLLRLGWRTLLDVATGRIDHIRKVRRADEAVVRQIRDAAREALQHPPHLIWETCTPDQLPQLARWILKKLDDRERAVVERRRGLWDGEPETLEEIASTLGITRERVRQIQEKAEKSLRTAFRIRAVQFIKSLSAVFTKFLASSEGMANESELDDADFDFGQKSREPRMAFDFLCVALELFPKDLLPEETRNEEDIFFDSVETMGLYRKAIEAAKLALSGRGRPVQISEIQGTMPRDNPRLCDIQFLQRCFEVSLEVGIDSTGKAGLKRWPFFNPQVMPQMAHRALLELGRPSHFSHVADRMNLMFPEKAPFSVHYIQNVLNGDKSFVRVGRGTYALANWGMKRPPFLKDFLAETLRARGGTATIEELVAAGRAKHSFKESSMRMILSMMPNLFTILPDGRCRLR